MAGHQEMNDSISLRESRPADTGEQEDIRNHEQSPSDVDQADSRRWDSNRRTKACVLVGSAVLQLPIWGTLGHHHSQWRWRWR